MASGLTQQAYKEVFEDWTGPTSIGTSATTAGVEWMESADGSDTAFVITDLAVGPVARAATAATDNNMNEISHRALSWSVQNGRLEMEARVRVATGVVTSIAFTVGFNDDQLEDSNTLPVELSTVTFTSNASTFIGVVYDPNVTDPNDVCAFWVDDDADSSQSLANLRFSGITPVLASWFGVRIVLVDAGSGNGVTAEITVVDESTGKSAQKFFTGTIDRDALLTPHIAFENRAAVVHTFDVDYIHVKQSRAD